MREIKFRVWDPQHEAMHSSEDAGLDWLFGLVERHGATLMQFTGLKDEHGKEIYEGDIVRANLRNGSVRENVTGKIVQNKPTAGFATELVDGDLYLIGRYVEVIGNIYENPNHLRNKP